MLRSTGERRPRLAENEEPLFGMHPLRPNCSSLMSEHVTICSHGSVTNASKWERAIPTSVAPAVQCPPFEGRVVRFGSQAPSSRFKDLDLWVWDFILCKRF